MTKHFSKTRFFIFALLIGLAMAFAAYVLLTDPNNEQQIARVQERSYVGYKKCAECHAEIAESHQTSGHFSAFSLTNTPDIKQKICGTTVQTNHDSGITKYHCDDAGIAVSMEKRFGGRLFPLDYAIGSGKHAITFLTILKDSDGENVGVEHRNTWYRHTESLGPTPGQSDFQPTRDVEHFGKIFRGEDLNRCVFCHVTTGEIVEAKIENLRQGVNCEKCHGPGSAHVALMESDQDSTETFIQRNWSAEEEIQMCGQCHRTSKDITPERLAAYPLSVTRFQPIGLELSRCYLESGKTLRCSTCHNPHEPVEARSLQEQVQTCLKCHQSETDVHCPVSPAQNCIECHMPKNELVDGIFFHDHWIRVVGESPDALPISSDVESR